MTSQEKISSGASLMVEGMAEILGEWCSEVMRAAQKLAEASSVGDSDDLILAKGLLNGVISPRAYSVATRDKGRRRKKWVRKCGRQRYGKA